MDDFGMFREIPKVYNGLKCPLCDSGLLDSDLNIVLASKPPKTAVKCSNDKCNYRGSRPL